LRYGKDQTKNYFIHQSNLKINAYLALTTVL
jgi:hypothetical protein